MPVRPDTLVWSAVLEAYGSFLFFEGRLEENRLISVSLHSTNTFEPCCMPSCVKYHNCLLKPNLSVERVTKQSLIELNHRPRTLERDGILKFLAVHSHPHAYGKVQPRGVGEFVFTQPTRARVRSYLITINIC